MSSLKLDVPSSDEQEDIDLSKLKFQLNDFIVELKEAKKSYKSTIIPIIERASIEACKYVKDQSMICAYLCLIFPKESSRDIRRYIHPKFKREYTKEAIEQMPSDIIQELFTLIIDNENDIIDGATALMKFYNESEPEDRKILREMMIEEFGNLQNVKEFIEQLKSNRIESKMLKNKTDKRTQIDVLTKLLLKIQTFHLSKNYVHTLNNVSTKWIRTGIQSRGSLEEIAQKLFRADARLEQIHSWFERQLAMLELNPDRDDLEPIPDFTPVLALQNKELQEEVATLRMDLESKQ